MGTCHRPNTSPAAYACPRGLTVNVLNVQYENHTLETLLGTAKKLGVNFFQYIRDRVSGARQMPSLAELIKQRSTMTNLSPSWAST